MKQLLDTHTFLWFVSGDSQLSKRVKLLIEDNNNESLISIASIWEIAIKYNLGKLVLNDPFDIFIRQEVSESSISILNIHLEHLNVISTLALHHRDPFDRLIIAQAIAEKIPIISLDSIFDDYPIQRLW